MKKNNDQELDRILNNTLTAFTKPFSTEEANQNSQRAYNAPTRKNTNPFLDHVNLNNVT